MTRFRRLAGDDDVIDGGGGGPTPPPPLAFGAMPTLYDLERGLFRMQSADPASIQKATNAASTMAKFGTPAFPAGTTTTFPGGLPGSLESFAELQRLQAKTNHPSSPQAAAGEMARLYDLFAQSAQPAALLTGRKQMMESALLPAFMGSGPQLRTINTIIQAITMYWIGAPVTGGGVVTAFLGGPDLSRELSSIFSSGSNSSQQIARRLARCFIVATTKVQYTLPGPIVGYMVVFPPLTL